MAEERGPFPRPHRGDRPPFSGPRPFRPGPPPPRTDAVPAVHAFRLRDGEREIEVSGTAPFVRQVLDDLPALIAKLRGEPSPRPAAIRMPAPPENPTVEVLGSTQEPPAPQARQNGSIEDRVLALLRESRRPLAVAAIRKRLGSDVTAQQVRRVLERAGPLVAATDQRPATYRIAGR
jgi:hypothetical protein